MDNALPFLETKEEDFSKFFLRDDSLRTLDWELALTLNKRYKCAAGCSMCYLNSRWISHEDFIPIADYTEKNLTKEWEDSFFSFAKNFEVLSTIDDMRYLKKNFDKQYDFYKRNCEEFSLSSVSDQSLFYHMPIIMNEMKFKDIYEISFSDAFLTHNYVRLKEMLKEITKRYSIKQVKIIRNTTDQLKVDPKKIKDFYKFLHGEGIGIFNHHNVLGDYEKVDDAAHAIYSEGAGPVSLLNQVTFLAFDDLYMELNDFTSKESRHEIGRLSDVAYDFSKLLPKLLEAKLKTYKYNAEMLQNKDAHFVKYFEHCAKSFRVNQDYNFIPYILLRDDVPWYKNMIGSGEWKHVGAGLLKTGEPNPRSIIEVIR